MQPWDRATAVRPAQPLAGKPSPRQRLERQFAALPIRSRAGSRKQCRLAAEAAPGQEANRAQATGFGVRTLDSELTLGRFKFTRKRKSMPRAEIAAWSGCGNSSSKRLGRRKAFFLAVEKCGESLSG